MKNISVIYLAEKINMLKSFKTSNIKNLCIDMVHTKELDSSFNIPIFHIQEHSKY